MSRDCDMKVSREERILLLMRRMRMNQTTMAVRLRERGIRATPNTVSEILSHSPHRVGKYRPEKRAAIVAAMEKVLLEEAQDASDR